MKLKLNIPSLPTETPRYTSSTTPKTINDYQNNPIYINPSAQGYAPVNIEQPYIPNEISEKASVSQKGMGFSKRRPQSRDYFSELSLFIVSEPLPRL